MLFHLQPRFSKSTTFLSAHQLRTSRKSRQDTAERFFSQDLDEEYSLNPDELLSYIFSYYVRNTACLEDPLISRSGTPLYKCTSPSITYIRHTECLWDPLDCALFQPYLLLRSASTSPLLYKRQRSSPLTLQIHCFCVSFVVAKAPKKY